MAARARMFRACSAVEAVAACAVSRLVSGRNFSVRSRYSRIQSSVVFMAVRMVATLRSRVTCSAQPGQAVCAISRSPGSGRAARAARHPGGRAADPLGRVDPVWRRRGNAPQHLSDACLRSPPTSTAGLVARGPSRLGEGRLGRLGHVVVALPALVLELDVLDGDRVGVGVEVGQRLVFRDPAAVDLVGDAPAGRPRCRPR